MPFSFGYLVDKYPASHFVMKLPFLSRFLGGDPNLETLRLTYNSSLSASNKAQFGKLLAVIVQELPDLLAVSIIDLKSSEVLASQHVVGKSNPVKAAAYNTEVIKQQRQSLQALGLASEEAIEDILITLRSQWHILRPLPGDRYFIHLMVSMRVTNLGIARDVLRTHASTSG